VRAATKNACLSAGAGVPVVLGLAAVVGYGLADMHLLLALLHALPVVDFHVDVWLLAWRAQLT
jgi:hypothetical protein